MKSLLQLLSRIIHPILLLLSLIALVIFSVGTTTYYNLVNAGNQDYTSAVDIVPVALVTLSILITILPTFHRQISSITILLPVFLLSQVVSTVITHADNIAITLRGYHQSSTTVSLSLILAGGVLASIAATWALILLYGAAATQKPSQTSDPSSSSPSVAITVIEPILLKIFVLCITICFIIIIGLWITEIHAFGYSTSTSGPLYGNAAPVDLMILSYLFYVSTATSNRLLGGGCTVGLGGIWVSNVINWTVSNAKYWSSSIVSGNDPIWRAFSTFVWFIYILILFMILIITYNRCDISIERVRDWENLSQWSSRHYIKAVGVLLALGGYCAAVTTYRDSSDMSVSIAFVSCFMTCLFAWVIGDATAKPSPSVAITSASTFEDYRSPLTLFGIGGILSLSSLLLEYVDYGIRLAHNSPDGVGVLCICIGTLLVLISSLPLPSSLLTTVSTSTLSSLTISCYVLFFTLIVGNVLMLSVWDSRVVHAFECNPVTISLSLTLVLTSSSIYPSFTFLLTGLASLFIQYPSFLQGFASVAEPAYYSGYSQLDDYRVLLSGFIILQFTIIATSICGIVVLQLHDDSSEGFLEGFSWKLKQSLLVLDDPAASDDGAGAGLRYNSHEDGVRQPSVEGQSHPSPTATPPSAPVATEKTTLL